nr:NUDIX domain-containing protein [Pseudomonas sp. RIT-PI-AD]
MTIAAACLHDDQGRLLLVRKRGTQAFMLPGGKYEAGESAHQALARELWEELHLRLDTTALQPLGRFSAVAANEPDTRIEAELFVGAWPLAAASDQEPGTLPGESRLQPAAELEELRWVNLEGNQGMTLAPLLADARLRRCLAAFAKIRG